MSRILKIFMNMKDSLYATGKRAIFVGIDQHGNKYFEKIADKKHNLRAARYIEERKELGPFGSPEIPVEWEAWLRGRRKNPPSEEEIQRNYAKMMQTKLRAQELDKKHIRGTQPSNEMSQSLEITEDIRSNSQRVSFPKYEEYEIAPGSKNKSKES